MADTATENAQIKEVITPEAAPADDGFELLDLDRNGIPDLLEDDEDVDAASDAQRAFAAVSHRAVTMTVDSTDDSTAGSSPYYVSGTADGFADEEDDYDEDYDDEEDDYDDEDYDGPSVAPAFRPEGAGAADRDELPIINGKRVERRKKPRVKKDPEFDLTHPDYTFTITKGLTNTVVKRKYLPHNRALATLLLSFLLAIALLCFFVFSVVYMVGNERLKRTQAAELEQLTRENELLASRNNELSSTVTQLSRSVNRSIEDRRADEAAFEASLIPDAFPLSAAAEVFIDYETVAGEEAGIPDEEDATDGASDDAEDDADAADSASSEGASDEEEPQADASSRIPVALFSPAAGTRVIAAGGGAVTRVTEDDVYGYRIMIDHRNGYQSIYRCATEPQVAVGITVMRGDTLFILDEMPENEEDAANQATSETTGEEEADQAASDADEADSEAGKTANPVNASFAYQILLNGDYINPNDIMQDP